MATKHNSDSSPYEIMAILVNTLDEKTAENQAQESLVKRIQELGGKITFEDFWGARGFAYKIKKATWGYYFVAQFLLSPTKVLEFKKDLNIDGKIVRFLITKVEKKIPAPKKYADIKKEWEATEKERKISEIEIGRTRKKNMQEQETSFAAKTKTSEDLSSQQKDKIDETLGKILQDSSLDL